MGRKFDLCILLTLVIVGFVFWWRQPPVIYSQPLSPKYKITIRSLPASNPDEVTLRITYHYPPAIGMYIVRELTIKRPANKLTFSHIVDPRNRLQCIHDNNGVGFLLLFHGPSDDLWHTTTLGENWGGWYGTDRNVWQERLETLREQFPAVPYTLLPKQLSNSGVIESDSRTHIGGLVTQYSYSHTCHRFTSRSKTLRSNQRSLAVSLL